MKVKFKNLSLVIATTVLLLIAVKANAQKEGTSCYSTLAGMMGTISHDGMHPFCLPPSIKVPSSLKGTDYERYMNIAINAGANKDDYDTAMINFDKALAEVQNSSDSEAKRASERGYKAAFLAKVAKGTDNKPYTFWLLVSGVYGNGD